MNGLEQIRAINATAQAQYEDKQRQSRGLKPKTALASILRKARSKPARVQGKLP